MGFFKAWVKGASQGISSLGGCIPGVMFRPPQFCGNAESRVQKAECLMHPVLFCAAKLTLHAALCLHLCTLLSTGQRPILLSRFNRSHQHRCDFIAFLKECLLVMSGAIFQA